MFFNPAVHSIRAEVFFGGVVIGAKNIKTLDAPIEIDRAPNRLDIKGGLQDILDAVVRNETVDAIMHKLDEKGTDSTEKANRSIRQALSDKGIL